MKWAAAVLGCAPAGAGASAARRSGDSGKQGCYAEAATVLERAIAATGPIAGRLLLALCRQQSGDLERGKFSKRRRG
jgi:hypothetical protein